MIHSSLLGLRSTAIPFLHSRSSTKERISTYALMATDVFQLLFASSFAAVFESA
jgi:hypothetical protein